jgi:hypothetical protein
VTRACPFIFAVKACARLRRSLRKRFQSQAVSDCMHRQDVRPMKNFGSLAASPIDVSLDAQLQSVFLRHFLSRRVPQPGSGFNRRMALLCLQTRSGFLNWSLRRDASTWCRIRLFSADATQERQFNGQPCDGLRRCCTVAAWATSAEQRNCRVWPVHCGFGDGLLLQLTGTRW